MQLSTVQLVATVVGNASYALMMGVLVAQRWSGGMGAGLRQRVQKKLGSAMGVGLIAGLAATLLSLWQASATMADVPLLESGPNLWGMFVNTSYGRFGLASVLVLTVGVVLHFARRLAWQSSAHRTALLGLLLAFAMCRVATGHAAENGFLGVATAVELIHVLSMALWSGAVIVAPWAVLPIIGRVAEPGSVAPYLTSLSSWATGALAAVMATGLYNAFRVLNQPAELGSTEYGWVLTTKLCFVGIAIALGGWNRFIGFPAVLTAVGELDGKKNDLHEITRVLRAESVALLIVLLAAAILTASAPPSSN